MFAVHTTFQEYINSFPLSTARIGVNRSGRYCGFDTMVTRAAAGDIPIKIIHSASGMKPTTSDNLEGVIMGAVLTPHGTIITTSDEIPIVLSANATANPRIDILYLEFIWADEYPGNSPTVSILQGVAAEIPVAPEVSNHTTQVELGQFYLAPNTSTLAGVTYTPAQVPLPGGADIVTNFPALDLRYARLAFPNTFTKSQYWAMDEVTLTDNTGIITLPETGNTFKVIGSGARLVMIGLYREGGIAYQVGTRITLIFENIGGTSFMDGSGDSLEQVFRLSGPTLPSLVTLPIASGDVVELIYRGNYSGFGTWEIVNPVSYLTKLCYSFNQSIVALQNPTPLPWIEVLANGDGPYCFEVGINTYWSKPFAYRRNRVGQLEFQGGFSCTSVGAGIQKLCTINPQYLNTYRPLITFIDMHISTIATVPAFINEYGAIWCNIPSPGVYICTSVVSGT